MPATITTTESLNANPSRPETRIVVHTEGRQAGLMELTIPRRELIELPTDLLKNIRDYVELIVPTEVGVLVALGATWNRDGLRVTFFSPNIALSGTWPIAAVLILDPVVFGTGAVPVSLQRATHVRPTIDVTAAGIHQPAEHRDNFSHASVRTSTSQTGRKRESRNSRKPGAGQSYETAVTAAGYSALVGMVLSMLV
ncbi:MAG: hypothetical protein R3C59_10205 [Planctomycetaceae bacterium]